MSQLIKNQDVTNNIFSIFLDKNDPSKSSIMLGSYDVEGLRGGSKMNVAKTMTAKSWEIALTSEKESLHVGSTPVVLESNSVIIDPQQDMIIMSAKDWTTV